MYSLQNQIRALPGVLVPFGDAEAIIFDEELFGAVPCIERRDHRKCQRPARAQSGPTECRRMIRLKAFLSRQARSLRSQTFENLFRGSTETLPAPSVMIRSPGPAAFAIASMLSSMLAT